MYCCCALYIIKKNNLIYLNFSVVYDGCPKNFADMIWWEQTPFEGTTVQPCPYGAQGQASRICNREIGWASPDMFNCVSNTFTELRDLVSSCLVINTTTICHYTFLY